LAYLVRVSIRKHPHTNLLTHRRISALCVSISFYEGDSLLIHGLAPWLFCTPATKEILKHLKKQFPRFFIVIYMIETPFCVSISFYEGVSLLTHGLNRPMFALCVSISFYEGGFLLTHGLAPGLFCTPATEAILKQLQQPFLGLISALCVSISFYKDVSLLTHGLAPGLFCTPAKEAILKQLK
jgi:hypothetical protein